MKHVYISRLGGHTGGMHSSGVRVGCVCTFREVEAANFNCYLAFCMSFHVSAPLH
jgi:hypothetical protein